MKPVLNFILAGLAGLVFACQASQPSQESASPYSDPLAEYFDKNLKPFYHGVASGDPLTDRVILWTRVTPDVAQPVEVQWQISESPTFEQITQKGSFTTDSTRDYTVKVDVEGLQPGTKYYYRFLALEATSITGETRTAPTGDQEQLKFGFVSCSNYQTGYFNAYKKLAEREDLNAVVHLGDYIYEYKAGKYADTTLHRNHLPDKEIITLADYRTRYAQYHVDPDLRAAHQKHPFIVIWDDHELANNTYNGGAQNHQPEEGDWNERFHAARQAYFEWLPMRERKDQKIYRTLKFGNLAELVLLDTRAEGRSKQVKNMQDPAYLDSTRTMLGQEQYNWFTNTLTASEAQWKIVGNQVILAGVNVAFQKPENPKYMDMWDGYPFEKTKLIDFLGEQQNVLFVTGDFHSSLAMEVTQDPLNTQAYDPKTGKGAVAAEFVVQSISAPNYDFYMSRDTVKVIEEKHRDPAYNPHMKHANLSDHGYVILDIQPEEVTAEWWYVDDLLHPSDKIRVGKRLKVKNGSSLLEEASVQ
ncbi:alkaline phosphatase D family protein [Rapidithrix thailandica]|uniref:Alkaline phosphatase D family protein n=1 Tax=Rapidithrix thailandica TaxID=413964 RepID=A0AAW9SBW7_9BACT